jgi:hypothetical protein
MKDELELKRKEVWVLEYKLKPFQVEADKKGWSLKKYMEWVLTKESDKLYKKQKK